MNIPEISPVEENNYQALVAMAKKRVRPEAEQRRKGYVRESALNLGLQRKISHEQAQKIIESRCRGTLCLDDIVHFQNGTIVTVTEILADPSCYNQLPCADPLEPEEGMSRAMFFANEGGMPVINSFLHGGRVFHLNTGSEHVGETMLSYTEALSRAKMLGDGDTNGAKAIISVAEGLDPIDHQQLLKTIKQQTGIPLKALRAYQHIDGQNLEKDHLAYAREVIRNFGEDNVLSIASGCYSWNEKGVWQNLEVRELKQAVQRRVEQSGRVLSGIINGVTDVLISEIYRPDHKFNIGDPEVVNCLNGVLHLDRKSRQWLLQPHNKNAFRTSQIPVIYDPEAKAPKFSMFLGEIFQDDPDKNDKIRAVLAMMAYTLMYHCRLEIFIILIGAGANGKSVLLYVVEKLAGTENVAGVQPSQFSNKFQRAHLHHKLANIVTEIRQGEVIADAELKAIVSGESVTVEHKNKDPFEMRPYATCWFATNHMPHTRDFSDALFRRALIIKFNRIFKENERNPTLKDELINELPGILNLALEAYAKAVDGNFTEPASSREAKKEWQMEADQVRQFVEDWCERDVQAEIEISRLYGAYAEWAEDAGIQKNLTKRSFRGRLERLGFGYKRTRIARLVTGIILRKPTVDLQLRLQR